MLFSFLGDKRNYMKLDEVKEKVSEWIESHRTEIVMFLMDFIQNKSPTGQEIGVQRDFIIPFFNQEMNFDEIDVFSEAPTERPNVNGTWYGNSSSNNLLLSGHVDVVDVGSESLTRWTKDPWKPVIENEKIYGRGSNDMKGGLTAMIWATKALMDLDIKLKGDLLLSCVIGEELDQKQWGAIPSTKKFQEKGTDIHFCIVPEPTNNEIHILSAAAFDFSISILGKEAHTSMKNLTQYPQRYGIPTGKEVGIDASVIMVDLLQRLSKLEQNWNMRYSDQIFGGGGYPDPKDVQGVGVHSINCTIIEAGNYIASIPGYAKIKGEVFYSPRNNDEMLWDEMKEVANGLASIYDWLKEHPIEMKWKEMFDWPAYDVSKEHPGVQSLAKAYESVTNKNAIISGFKAVDDAAYIQRDCGVDAISFGPGDLYMGTHGPDEYIPIDQLIIGTKTLATMIIEWCGLFR
jgi:acetylornithine deacetylase